MKISVFFAKTKAATTKHYYSFNIKPILIILSDTKYSEMFKNFSNNCYIMHVLSHSLKLMLVLMAASPISVVISGRCCVTSKIFVSKNVFPLNFATFFGVF